MADKENSILTKRVSVLPLTDNYPFLELGTNRHFLTNEYQKSVVLHATNNGDKYLFVIKIDPQDLASVYSRYKAPFMEYGVLCRIVHVGVEANGLFLDLEPVTEAKADSSTKTVITDFNIYQQEAISDKVVAYKVDVAPFAANTEMLPEETSAEGKEDAKIFKQWLFRTASEHISSAKNELGNRYLVTFNNSQFEDISLVKFFNYTLQVFNPDALYLQKLFAFDNIKERIFDFLAYLSFKNLRQSVDNEIQQAVNVSLQKSQRNYYLSELIRTARKELTGSTDVEDDVQVFMQRLESLKVPQEIYEKIRSEIARLESSPQNSPDSSVQRNYVEWLLNIPWSGNELEEIDLKRAREVLDEDHYGLEEVKERILQYIAVLSRVNNTSAPILCLIGPPGIGKTSLAASIAKALGRKYVRMALGGLHDESELRGHRRTYVGAMPGRIVQSLSKAKTNNPLFLLDEIDKVGRDTNRGDPSAALLEILDPSQNHTFHDNYIDVDYDLSNVLFLATSNSYNIPEALLDRMDVIELGSYTYQEKFEIARRHILPKVLKRNAVKPEEFELSDEMLNYLIAGYTMEAGVRSLERLLENLVRHAIKDIIENERQVVVITKEYIEKAIGPVFNEVDTKIRTGSEVGLIMGLSYTSVGGEPLPIEAAAPPGKGAILQTGSLGDNIKESISAALTVIRQRAKDLGIDEDFYKNRDFHVHFPNAAVKKDGPSAGAAITTVLTSVLTGKPIDRDIGMTGEISLRGRVMIIGGVKEKVMSAYRAGVRHIILPKDNMKHLYKIPQSIRDDMEFYGVETIDEVFDIVFNGKKRPLRPAAEKAKEREAAEKAKAQAEQKATPVKPRRKTASATKADAKDEAKEVKAEAKAEPKAKAASKAKSSTRKSTKAKAEASKEETAAKAEKAPAKRTRKTTKKAEESKEK